MLPFGTTASEEPSELSIDPSLFDLSTDHEVPDGAEEVEREAPTPHPNAGDDAATASDDAAAAAAAELAEFQRNLAADIAAVDAAAEARAAAANQAAADAAALDAANNGAASESEHDVAEGNSSGEPPQEPSGDDEEVEFVADAPNAGANTDKRHPFLEWAIWTFWTIWMIMQDRPLIVFGIAVSVKIAVTDACWDMAERAVEWAKQGVDGAWLAILAAGLGVAQISKRLQEAAPAATSATPRQPFARTRPTARATQQRKQAQPAEQAQPPPKRMKTQQRSVPSTRTAGRPRVPQTPRTPALRTSKKLPKSDDTPQRGYVPEQNLGHAQRPNFAKQQNTVPKMQSQFAFTHTTPVADANKGLCTKTNNVALLPFTAETREIAIKNRKDWNVLNVTRNPNRPLQKQFADLTSCVQAGTQVSKNASTPAQLAVTKAFAMLGHPSLWTDDHYARGISMIWDDLFTTYMIDDNVIRTIDRQNLSQLRYAPREMGQPFNRLKGQHMLEFVQKYELLRGECQASGAFVHSLEADPNSHAAAFERESLKDKIPSSLKQHCEEILKLLHESTVGAILRALRMLGTTRTNHGPEHTTHDDLSKAQETIVALVANTKAMEKKFEKKFENMDKRIATPKPAGAQPGGPGRTRPGGKGQGKRENETPAQLAEREKKRDEHRDRCKGKPCPRGPNCQYLKRGGPDRCFYHHPPEHCPEALAVAEDISSDEEMTFYCVEGVGGGVDGASPEDEGRDFSVAAVTPLGEAHHTTELCPYVDNGCPMHIVDDLSYLHAPKPYAPGKAGTAAKGKSLEITHEGRLLFRMEPLAEIFESRAFFSPEVARNILSPHVLEADHGILDRCSQGYLLMENSPERHIPVAKYKDKYHAKIEVVLPPQNEVFMLDMHKKQAGPEPDNSDNKPKVPKKTKAVSLREHQAGGHFGYHPDCEPCKRAHLKRREAYAPVLDTPRRGEKKPFGTLLIDGVGLREKTLFQARNMVYFVQCYFCKWVEAVCVSTKKDAGPHVVRAFKELADVRSSEVLECSLYGDCEFNTKATAEALKIDDGHIRASRPHSSKQHAHIERWNEEIQAKTRATIACAGVPSSLWNLVVCWLVIVWNFWTPVHPRVHGVEAKAMPKKTPYEHRFNAPPQCTPRDPPMWFAPVFFIEEATYDVALGRFGDRAQLGWFVGIDRVKKSWMVVSRPGQTERKWNTDHEADYRLKTVQFLRFCSAEPEGGGEVCLTEPSPAEVAENDEILQAYAGHVTATRQRMHNGDKTPTCDTDQVKFVTVPPEKESLARAELQKHKRYGAIQEASEAEVENAKRNGRFARAAFYYKVKRDLSEKMRLALQGFRVRALEGYESSATNMCGWESFMCMLSWFRLCMEKDMANDTPPEERCEVRFFDVVSAYLQSSLNLGPWLQPVIGTQFGNYRCSGAVNGLRESGKAWELHRDGIFHICGLKKCCADPALFASKKSRFGTHVDDFMAVGPKRALGEDMGKIATRMDVTEQKGKVLAPGVVLYDLLGCDVLVCAPKAKIAIGMQSYIDKSLLKMCPHQANGGMDD